VFFKPRTPLGHGLTLNKGEPIKNNTSWFAGGVSVDDLHKMLNLHPLSLLRLLIYRVTAFTVTDIPGAKPGNSMFCSSVRRECSYQ
jgi:hypothetical protein